jgi:DNA modification methylase
MVEPLIVVGDCLDVMRGMDGNSIDAIATDPPYGLSFMGKNWDHGIPGIPFWVEALRIAKPGCHLLAFGGTRTFHRLACAIEDAGWEIRDCLGFLYGSGFPKSLDVSKAIDKAAGKERVVSGIKPGHEAFANRKTDGHITALKNTGGGGFRRPWMDDDEKREAYHHTTSPATDVARQWEGWGTALKPAVEYIILARKPLDGTIAGNVQKWGTGALNIDACRVPYEGKTDQRTFGGAWRTDKAAKNVYDGGYAGDDQVVSDKGRWPANIIHDGSDEATSIFPETNGGSFPPARGNSPIFGKSYGENAPERRMPAGNASRFFYCAKASRAEREIGLAGMPEKSIEINEPHNSKSLEERGRMKARNFHPTVKPLELMRYLCRLITPKGGKILDPFMGSGTTGMAAEEEGFSFIGIEQNPEYAEIAKKRISAVKRQFPLF